MRRAVSIALVFVVALLASAAVATTITETGLSVIFSSGSEKKPVEGLTVFKDQYGSILTPSNGVLTVPAGERVFGWIFMKEAYKAGSFDIKWTLKTLENSSNLRPTTFSEDFGWSFQLEPTDTAGYRGNPRGLKIVTRAIGAKGDYVKVIFKWTYKLSSVITKDLIVINPVPRELMENNGSSGSGGTDVSAALEVMKENDRKMADRINANDERLTKVEDWIRSATSGSTTVASSSPSSSEVTFPMRFVGSFNIIEMAIYRPDGKVEKRTINTTSTVLTLPRGMNTTQLWVDYGRGFVKKAPISVEVNDSTSTGVKMEVYQEGVGR